MARRRVENYPCSNTIYSCLIEFTVCSKHFRTSLLHNSTIMKKILSLFTIVVVVITSCTKEEKTPKTNNGTNSITSSVVTGNFIITKFTDTNSSDDRTTDFSGYSFTFNDNGSITVDHNGVISTGSYTEKPAHEGEAAELLLSFNDPNLVKLSKKWAIN